MLFRQLAATLVILVSAAAADTGSISGVVVHAVTGQPLAGVDVFAMRLSSSSAVQTDDAGRFRLEGVPAGRQGIAVGTFHGVGAVHGRTLVRVEAGGEVNGIKIRARPNTVISGKVTDQNGEPLAGAEVILLGREYSFGKVQYYRRAITRADDEGIYTIAQALTPFATWVIQAQEPRGREPAVSDAPTDPKARRPAMVATYHPNAESPDQAGLIHTPLGATLEGIDIRMRRAPSFCVEAQLNLPGDVLYALQPTQPATGLGVMGGLAGFPANELDNPDGKLRRCGLPAGEYRLTAIAGDRNAPSHIASSLIAITDEDVKNVVLDGLPRVDLEARVVWANEAPEEPIEGQALIAIQSLHHSFGAFSLVCRAEITGACAPTSTSFTTGETLGPLLDEYRVRTEMLERLPDGLYVAALNYGGRSVIDNPLRLGSELEGTPLVVTLDHGAGAIRARAVDDAGDPVSDASLVVIPKEAKSEPAVAALKRVRAALHTGEVEIGALPPGEYYVLATTDEAQDVHVETVERLFNARLRGEEVEIARGQTVDLTLPVIRLR